MSSGKGKGGRHHPYEVPWRSLTATVDYGPSGTHSLQHQRQEARSRHQQSGWSKQDQRYKGGKNAALEPVRRDEPKSMTPLADSPAITFDHAELQQVVQPTTKVMMEAMEIDTHPNLARAQKEMMSRLLSEVGRIFHLPNPTLPMLGEDGKPQTFRLNMKHDQAIRTRPYKTSPAL